MRNMKDSGIEWIGKIPEDWVKVKLKDYYTFEKGKNSNLYTKEYIGENLGTFPVYSGQTENEGIMGSINSFDYDVDECLFTTTVGAKVMTPKVISGKFSLSQNCLIMNQIKTCNNKFIYYLLLPLFEYEKSMIPTYMQPSLRISDLNKYMFYIPSLNEQELISDYLNSKVKEIDNIISKTKETMEEYKKYKQLVITEVVTKGLNPNAEMKDSGIEWIGQIPKHWKVTKFKKAGSMVTGYSFKSDNFVNEGIPVLMISNIQPMQIVWDEKSYVDISFYEQPSIPKVLKNDLVFALTRPIISTGIKVAIYENDEKVLLNQRNAIFRPNNLLTIRWCYYIMLNAMFINEFDSKIDKTGQQPNISHNDIKNISIPLPNKEEQEEIVKYLDKKCNEIDKLIFKKEQLITELEQYKKSLIYECVTGKKEVSPAYAD